MMDATSLNAEILRWSSTRQAQFIYKLWQMHLTGISYGVFSITNMIKL